MKATSAGTTMQARAMDEGCCITWTGIIKTYGKDGKRMLKIVKRLFPLAEEGRVNRLTSELTQERQRNDDLEAALVEVADMVAAQDDAIVEIAGIIGE